MSAYQHFPYSPAMQAELAPHISLISEFRSLLSPLLTTYPSSYPLLQCLSDDRACYRWLKARSFSPSAALTLLTSALQYRQLHQLDTILTRPFPLASHLRLLSCDSWHSFDALGHPIFIERFGHMSSTLSTIPQSTRLHYHHYINEYVQRVLLPLASRRAGHLIDQVTCIMDMSNFSTSHINKSNIAYVSSTIHCNALLYPELMSHCYITNAPYVFSMGWSIVRGMIDEVTRGKIHVVKAIKGGQDGGVVDVKQLPVWLGGECRCEVGGEDGCDGCMSKSAEDRQFDEWVRTHEHDVAEQGDSEGHVRKSSTSETEIEQARQAAITQQHANEQHVIHSTA